MSEFNWDSNWELQMVNSHSELLWHERKSQGKEVSCESRVFNLFLLKHPTIFTSRGRPRKIPCLPNPDYLAAANNNNNTCETLRARCPHAAVGRRLSAAAVTGWMKLCIKSALYRSYSAAPVKRLQKHLTKVITDVLSVHERWLPVLWLYGW